MLTILCGPSGSGKTTLQNELGKRGYKEIVSYTTRSIRPGEVQDVDYHFVSYDTFFKMRDNHEFAEVEEYSQKRFYGTLMKDIKEAVRSDDNYVVVVTPNGMRAITNGLQMESGGAFDAEKYLTVMVHASLGERVKRYIGRCGVDKFSFDDMNEINARVNRDFGMFLNMENMVDINLDNDTADDIKLNADYLIGIMDNKRKIIEERKQRDREEAGLSEGIFPQWLERT